MPADHPPEWIAIAGNGIAAAINPLGAELSSIRDDRGREWMTDADPAFWTGRSPLLFPIVGALNGGRYRHGGREFALPQHGFARRRQFDLIDQTGDSARFRLSADDESRADYPFDFTLDAAYVIDGWKLSVTVTVTNTGDTVMPASFGYHPAFACPLPGDHRRDGHRILFDQVEPGSLAWLQDGLVAGHDRPSPLADGRTLLVADAMFEQGALIWDNPASRSVVYSGPGGGSIRVDFPDAHRLGIWSRPGARFVCIEPWGGDCRSGRLCGRPIR